MTYAVKLEDITFSYGTNPAVEGLSLSVPRGEFLGLVGPNGSGKTTLLKLMLGILEQDSGEISVFGEKVNDFSDGERIGYVPQRSSRKGNTMPITVREVVTMGRYPASPFRRLGESDIKMIDDALRTVGIFDLSNRRISQLSGGQKQRVFIARALASGADLLALDEPTVGVDAESRDDFYRLLNTLQEELITIILIEHDLGIVAEHADRIACINRNLHYVGPADEFVESKAKSNVYSNQRVRSQENANQLPSGYAVEN